MQNQQLLESSKRTRVVTTRTCLLCNMDKGVHQFPRKSPVCYDCYEYLCDHYLVPWARTSRGTVQFAYLNLLLAVRRLAVDDKRLKDFESYWVNGVVGSLIRMLLDSVVHVRDQGRGKSDEGNEGLL